MRAEVSYTVRGDQPPPKFTAVLQSPSYKKSFSLPQVRGQLSKLPAHCTHEWIHHMQLKSQLLAILPKPVSYLAFDVAHSETSWPLSTFFLSWS